MKQSTVLSQQSTGNTLVKQLQTEVSNKEQGKRIKANYEEENA